MAPGIILGIAHDWQALRGSEVGRKHVSPGGHLMDQAQNETEFSAKVIRVDFNRERYIRYHQKQFRHRGYTRKDYVSVACNADLSLDTRSAAANEEKATNAYRQSFERVREFSAVFFACMLSVIALLILAAAGDRSRSSDTFAQDIEPRPESTNWAHSGTHDSNAQRGIRSQGALDPRVEHLLDSDFRATLGRIARWREQNRLLVMYRDQLAAGAEFGPPVLLVRPNHGSPPLADSQREWN